MIAQAPLNNINDDYIYIVKRAMEIKSSLNISLSEALKVLEIGENEKAHARQTAILENIRDRLTAGDSAAEPPHDQSESGTEPPRRGRPRKEE